MDEEHLEFATLERANGLFRSPGKLAGFGYPVEVYKGERLPGLAQLYDVAKPPELGIGSDVDDLRHEGA